MVGDHDAANERQSSGPGAAFAGIAEISEAGRNLKKVSGSIDAVLKIVEEETAAIRTSGVPEIEKDESERARP